MVWKPVAFREMERFAGVYSAALSLTLNNQLWFKIKKQKHVSYLAGDWKDRVDLLAETIGKRSLSPIGRLRNRTRRTENE
jgi:hypothetical protein